MVCRNYPKLNFARNSSRSSESLKSYGRARNEKSPLKRKTDESDTILLLLGKINRLKHLVNLEERLIDEEIVRENHCSNDESYADRRKLRRTVSEDSDTEKRRIFVGSSKASIMPMEDNMETMASLPSPSSSLTTPLTRLSAMIVDEKSAKSGLPGVSLSSYQPCKIYSHHCYQCQNPHQCYQCQNSHNRNPFYLAIGD